jgi:cytochrome bd-type quinol oxidase subunit 2
MSRTSRTGRPGASSASGAGNRTTAGSSSGTVNSSSAGTGSDSGRSSGPGRLLIAVYGVFAVAATARAGFQIATKFSEAPVAYLLSAVAAVVYVAATISLARKGAVWFRAAVATICVELLGVLVVGSLSIFDAKAFPQETVWSLYGRGYGFVPLLLPVLGLWWLYRHRADSRRTGDSA